MHKAKAIIKKTTVAHTCGFYFLIPEENRCEILNGELHHTDIPNTRHQRVSRNLEFALIKYNEIHGLGEIFHAPYNVIFSKDNVVQPDILLICKERAGLIDKMSLRGAPDLVVEITAPETLHKDLKLKKKLYADFGVQEYWIINSEKDFAEVLL